MKKLLSLVILVCVVEALHAQQPYVYSIFADSVKITNDCDTAELIIENHTQNIPGFLFNKGRGRTEFRKALTKINDTLYTIGPDSIKLPYAWVQGGNSFGTTGILGTKDNNHIDFYTNNAQRGRWMNDGNLLIGTTTDNGYKLNVNGSLQARQNSLVGATDVASITATTESLKAYGNFSIVTAPVIGVNGGLRVQTSTWSRPGATSMKLNNVDMTAYDGRIFFGGPNAPYLAVRTWGNNVEGGPFLRTKYTVGNDSNPEGWNDSWAAFGASSQSEFQTASSYPSGVNYYYLETHLNSPVVSSNTGQVGVRAPMKIGARQLLFYTGNNDLADTEAMRITDVGNLLIGTKTDNGNKLQVSGNSYFSGAQQVTGNVRFSGLTSDTTKTRIVVSDALGNLSYRNAPSWAANDLFGSDLAVTGTISAPKMTITQPGAWPDYVFKPQYKLPSLNDVEQFIQKNSHLPGVPSATEVEKKGIDVGENQAVLLKKIEELTLYLIQQQKEQQEMKNEIAELKALLKNK